MEVPDSPCKSSRKTVENLKQMPKRNNDDALVGLSSLPLHKSVKQKLSIGPAKFIVVRGSRTQKDAFDTLDAYLRAKSVNEGLNIIQKNGGTAKARTYVCAHSHKREGTKMQSIGTCKYLQQMCSVAVKCEEVTSVLKSLTHLGHQLLEDVEDVHDMTEMTEVTMVFLFQCKESHINNCHMAKYKATQVPHRRRTSMTSGAMRKNQSNITEALCTGIFAAASALPELLLSTSTPSSSFIRTAASRKCGIKDKLLSVVYLESFFEKAIEADIDTVAYIDKQPLPLPKNNQYLIDTAFMSPGHLVRFVRQIKEKTKNVLIDVDFRHHNPLSGLKGSYHAVVSMPDHSYVELATMTSTREENNEDSKLFFERLHEVVDGIDEFVGIMADNAFQILQQHYPGAEFRLCHWHVKQNLKSQHSSRKDQDAYSAMVNATTESEADEAWGSLTKSSMDYLNKRESAENRYWSRKLTCLYKTRLFWRSRTSSTLGESVNQKHRDLRKIVVTKYFCGWMEAGTNTLLKLLSKYDKIEQSRVARKYKEWIKIAVHQRSFVKLRDDTMCPLASSNQVQVQVESARSSYIVTFDPESPKISTSSCECGVPKVCKRPCGHLIAALEIFRRDPGGQLDGPRLDPPFEYTAGAMKELLHGVSIKLVSTANLKANEDAQPSAIKPIYRGRGRPMKARRLLSKREVAIAKRMGVRVQICKTCGLGGHNSIHCETTQDDIDQAQKRDKTVGLQARNSTSVPDWPWNNLFQKDLVRHSLSEAQITKDVARGLTPAGFVCCRSLEWFLSLIVHPQVHVAKIAWINVIKEGVGRGESFEKTYDDLFSHWKANEDFNYVAIAREKKYIFLPVHEPNHWRSMCVIVHKESIGGFIADSMVGYDVSGDLSLLHDFIKFLCNNLQKEPLEPYRLQVPQQGNNNCAFHVILLHWVICDQANVLAEKGHADQAAVVKRYASSQAGARLRQQTYMFFSEVLTDAHYESETTRNNDISTSDVMYLGAVETPVHATNDHDETAETAPNQSQVPSRARATKRNWGLSDVSPKITGPRKSKRILQQTK